MKYVLLALGLILFNLTYANKSVLGNKSPVLDNGTAIKNTWSTTRIINGHSTEMLRKKRLDFRITHRFGDMGGMNGGGHNLYGLDNSTDIRIAFEYGISEKFNIGFGRSKGSGPLKEIIDGYAKYKLMEQTDEFPISVVIIGTSGYSAMKANPSNEEVSGFTKNAHRFSYSSQLLIAKKFNKFSLQISPTYVHRNLVYADDENDLLSTGLAAKVQLSSALSIIGEYYYNFKSNRVINGVKYYNPMGIALEIKAGLHVFQINVTNSRGIGETQFIPYTSANIGVGEIRLGFTISRKFKL